MFVFLFGFREVEIKRREEGKRKMKRGEVFRRRVGRRLWRYIGCFFLFFFILRFSFGFFKG